VSASKDDHSQTNPWDAQKLDVTGSWSVSKSERKQRSAKGPETLVAPDIEPLLEPEAPAAGDLLAERFDAIDESSPSLDWDPDGDTDAVPHAEESDEAREAEESARADAIEVELLSAADPSTDAPTGEMTIPSFLPAEDTVESEAPRVVQGRVANGFVTDGDASSVWANTPIRAKALRGAPRIELRRRARRPLARIDDGSASETTEWMAQGVTQPTADSEGVPFGPRVVDQTDGGIEVEALDDDAISQIDPEPVRMDAGDVIYVRRSSHPAVEADPFRTFVLKRRGPEDDGNEPPPPWVGMVGQTAMWILVIAGGIGMGCLGVMALLGRLPF
jgi:hypothetical protein